MSTPHLIVLHSYKSAFGEACPNGKPKLRSGFLHNGTLLVLTTFPKQGMSVKVTADKLVSDHLSALDMYIVKAANQSAEVFNLKSSGHLALDASWIPLLDRLIAN